MDSPTTNSFKVLLFISIFSLHWSEGAVTPADALAYLRKYGHAPERSHMTGGLMTQDALSDSVMSFQRFAGLPMTGQLDRETLQKMEQKRCGNFDIAGTENARRKRYALQGTKWPKMHLTYKISRYTSDLSRSKTDEEIRAAFKWWSDKSGLTFSQVSVSSKADIDIKFAPGSHGDGDPFDGPGNTLAHAFFPVFGGDAHFDEDETWLLQSSRGGTKLRIVAAHEFGHSLGLSHSDEQKSLMAPFYNPRITGLHTDDILAIRSLYGHPMVKPSAYPSPRPTRRPVVTRTTTRRTTTTKTPPIGACNGRFEAITRLRNGSVYAFLGRLFWRLNNQGADKGFPQRIENVWGINGPVDAALTYNKETDLFVGTKVYRFNGAGERLNGFPERISTVYRGIPSNIDAAFEWSGNGKLYFIKGQQYWRYNTYARRTDPGYPKPLTVWKGLPNHIDAAFQWNGRTYFFSDGKYYRLDDTTIMVAQLKEYPYPRRTDEWWLGCKDNTLRQAGSSLSGSVEEDVEEDNAGGSGSTISHASKSTLFIVPTILVVLNTVLG